MAELREQLKLIIVFNKYSFCIIINNVYFIVIGFYIMNFMDEEKIKPFFLITLPSAT